jgi:hypothetical protein
MPFGAVLPMRKENIQRVKDENDRLIMKFFGLEKLFQENQDVS